MAGQVALNLQALTFNDHPQWEWTCAGGKKERMLYYRICP